MFGVWHAAWPLVRTDLGLTYVQVGLLLSIPAVFGNVLEPAIGLAGDGRNRRALVRAGGLAFAVALALLATGSGFVAVLMALMLLSPASGAFVGLSQATLMDLEPRRHEANMARWVLAGSIGVVCGPLALAAATALGLGWRPVLAGLALVGLGLLAGVWRAPMTLDVRRSGGTSLRTAATEAIQALRDREVRRSLVLLQLADLALDVFLGLLALYFVDVVGAGEAEAAAAVAVWTGAGLFGDALVIPLLARLGGVRWVRASAAVTLVVFPAFLLSDGGPVTYALLAGLGLLCSGWYAVLQARLYSALPDRSATVMALTSAAGIPGGVLPVAVAGAAGVWGLGAAMWLLLAGPIALVLGLRGAASSS